MIDIENEVYEMVEQAVTTQFPSVTMSDVYTRTATSFPFATLIMRTNVPWRRSRTTENVENHAAVMFQAEVYSDKRSGKKAECKKIMQVIDREMARLGFTRNFYDFVENPDDATICRLVTRYQAVVSKDKVIYRR